MEKFSDGMFGDGERLYPKLVNGQVVDSGRIAEIIEQRTSFTRGDVLGVLAELSAIVEEQIADGNSVKIDGLGVLRPVLGLVEKNKRSDWTDEANRLTTGHNVRLKSVRFRPESTLLHKASQAMSLDRVSNLLGYEQPSSTIDERAAMARQYISEHGFMRVADYAALTHLSRTTASRELCKLSADTTSGITSSGTRAGKVYVIRNT